MTDPDYEPDAHYDRVTAAWQLLLGHELHYGLFESGRESLPVATAALTSAMLDAAELATGLSVLDVGCGSGAPACRLAAEFGARVLGITTSKVGVETATRRARAAGLADIARFEQRDGTATGLADESFDRIWVLESSHLMRDRAALVGECARVLRPGGRLVLCDIVRQREIPMRELIERREDFVTLRAAFGDAHMEPLARYAELARRAGLVVERLDDLTAATRPTFDRWRANARDHEAEAATGLGVDGLAAFVRSADILEQFWDDGTLGYGLLAATKPDEGARALR